MRRPEPAEDAARLYADARADMDADKMGQAQRKLEVLVARFPQSPLAELARRDLQRVYAGAAAAKATVGPKAVEPLVSPRDTRAAAFPASMPQLGGVVTPQPPTPQQIRLQAAADDLRQRAGDRVFFTEGSDDIGSRAHMALQAQAEWLLRHPNVRIVLEGHADDHGGTDLNRQIGRRRAEAVRLRLTDLGIAAQRIDVVSLGREAPVADCPQKHCAEQNRRVVTVVSDAPLGTGVTSLRP
jgi:peptidoglycan-associated lipoprotein